MFNENNQPLSKLEFVKNKKYLSYSPSKFNTDNLEIFSHPIMGKWETPYIKKHTEIVISHSGIILEVCDS